MSDYRIIPDDQRPNLPRTRWHDLITDLASGLTIHHPTITLRQVMSVRIGMKRNHPTLTLRQRQTDNGYILWTEPKP